MKLDKTLSVTIVKQREDGTLFKISVSGEDATKWKNAVEGQATLSYAHGIHFPNIDWKTEELKINDSIY